MENKLLVLNVVANTSAPIIELLRDTATTAIDYRHLDDPAAVHATLREQLWDLILVNAERPDSSLSNCVQLAQQHQPHVPLLVIVDTTTVTEVVDLMRQGVAGVVDRADHPRLMDLVQQELQIKRTRHRSVANTDNHSQYALPDHYHTFEQMEAELEQSKTQLQLLIECTPAAIAMFDRDMRYLAASRRFLTDYRLSEQSIVGRYHYDVFPEIPEQTREINRRCLQGAIEAREKEPFLRADGTLDWVRWEVRPWYDGHGEIGGMILFSEVITDRVQAEDALRESRDLLEQRVQERTKELEKTTHRLEAIFNHSGDGIVLLNIHDGLQQVNYAFAEAFGVETNDCPGTSLTSYFEPDQAAYIEASVREVADSHQIRRIEARARRKDGTLFEVEISLAPVNRSIHRVANLVGIIRDITVRKEQDRQLRYHASVQANMSDAVIVTDMNLHIQSWNKAAERIYGWSEAEVLGLNSSTILRAEFRSLEEYQQVIDRIAAGSWWQAETIQQRKDGSRIHILGSVTVVHDESGKPLGIVAVNRDISALKQAEEAREKYVAEIHDLYNNAPCGYHSLNAEGLVVQINDTELKWLGYTREEIVGKLRAVDILTAESIATFRAHFPILKETGSLTGIELELKRKDGSLFTVLVNVTAVYDDSGAFVKSRSTLFDITELKKSQNALKESEQRYRTLIDTMSEGITMQAVDGRVVTCNAAAERILGLTYDQLIGRTSVDPRWRAIHEDGSPFPGDTHPGMVALATGEGQKNVVMGVHKPDGALRWILINAQPILDHEQTRPSGVVATFTDITERKQVEKKLEALSQRLQLATETGGIGVWDWDIQTDNLIWDDQMFTLYGISRNLFSGTTRETWSSGLLHPEDFTQMQIAMQAALRGDKALDTEFRISRPNGELRYLKVKAVIFRDSTGQPTRMIGVNWDITLLKQAEEGLRLALEKEKEVSELKSRFISTASHEFRTPLAVILATTESLTIYRDRMDEAQINKRLDKIRLQVNTMKEIMDDVLQLARMQAKRIEFRPANSDLNALCQDIIDEFQGRPDYHERIIFRGLEKPIMLYVDLHLMRRIIGNLVSNALKYSPPDSAIHLTLSQDGESVRCQVTDHGIGIPADDLKHLFEPFHRAANVGDIAGTGLGLSIAREAVLTHGGSIEVESEVGQGTTFTVVLPVTRQEP
ncbi:MAG TPA: PAS domain S-box protein [Aggregatilineales bacterium]|nr:PAS domain S-box protein [Aggregatilineales bacterium]